MEYLQEIVDYGILGILALMSVLSVAFALERFFFYRKVKVQEYNLLETLETDLTKNLTALSIISSNAPYVGLLGTVIGIMLTFYDMGKAGEIDTGTVLIGLSLALKATALGLVVAIPSLIFYTSALRRCDVIIARWKELHVKKY